MSRNLTDGGDLPVFVLILELDDRIDFAGAGLDLEDEEAFEDTDGARYLACERTRCRASPRTATERSLDGVLERVDGWIKLDQKFWGEVGSSLLSS